MTTISFDFITGMCFGLEFSDMEPDEEGPYPWLVIHLGILRVMVTKYEMEE